MSTHFIGDTAALQGRSLRHILRSPDTIITTAVMPIGFMLLFVYVFGGAIDVGSGSYVNYLLPGILIITIASGISYTAYRLFQDLQSGIFERFQSMPIARSSVLWAHVGTSLVSNMVSVVVVVLVALLMGFRTGSGLLAWLAVAGILVLFTLSLTWVAVIPGLTAKTADGAIAFSYPLIFLPFISSAFVPTETMPGPVRWFAEHQPVTSIVNAIRALFAQQPVGSDIWVALGWIVGILVVAYAFAMLAYRRRMASADLEAAELGQRDTAQAALGQPGQQPVGRLDDVVASGGALVEDHDGTSADLRQQALLAPRPGFGGWAVGDGERAEHASHTERMGLADHGAGGPAGTQPPPADLLVGRQEVPRLGEVVPEPAARQPDRRLVVHEVVAELMALVHDPADHGLVADDAVADEE